MKSFRFRVLSSLVSRQPDGEGATVWHDAAAEVVVVDDGGVSDDEPDLLSVFGDEGLVGVGGDEGGDLADEGLVCEHGGEDLGMGRGGDLGTWCFGVVSRVGSDGADVGIRFQDWPSDLLRCAAMSSIATATS